VAAYRGEPSYLAAVKLALLTVAGLLFIAGAAQAGPEDRRFIRAAATIAMLVLAVALTAEAWGDMPINRSAKPNAETGALMRNPGKGASILVALVWGAIAACAGGANWQRMIWRAIAALTLILSFQFDMNTNTVGFAVGAVAFVLTYVAPRIMPIIGAAGLAVWTLVAPFVAPFLNTQQFVDAVPLSWAMRLKIWSYTHDRIMENPLFGLGLGGSRHFTDVLDARGTPVTAIPLHPHSMSLHVWLETGAIGAVLVAATILSCGVAISRSLGAHPLAAAAAGASLGTIGVIWNVSYGAWQEWWFAVPFIAGALAAAARR
jgi:O-antigen ligase